MATNDSDIILYFELEKKVTFETVLSIFYLDTSHTTNNKVLISTWPNFSIVDISLSYKNCVCMTHSTHKHKTGLGVIII